MGLKSGLSVVASSCVKMTCSLTLMEHFFTTRARWILALLSWNMPEPSGKKKSIDGITWSFSTFRNSWIAMPWPDQLRQPQIITLQFADLNRNYIFFWTGSVVVGCSHRMLLPWTHVPTYRSWGNPKWTASWLRRSHCRTPSQTRWTTAASVWRAPTSREGRPSPKGAFVPPSPIINTVMQLFLLLKDRCSCQVIANKISSTSANLVALFRKLLVICKELHVILHRINGARIIMTKTDPLSHNLDNLLVMQIIIQFKYAWPRQFTASLSP